MEGVKCSLSAGTEQSAPCWHKLCKYTTFGSSEASTSFGTSEVNASLRHKYSEVLSSNTSEVSATFGTS